VATSSFVRSGTLAVFVLLGACGGDAVAVREGHQAFQATERAVSFLSVARAGDGETLASWREETEHGDVIVWTDPSSDEAVAHEVTLGPGALAWQLTPLLAMSTGFSRMALGEGQFGELRISPGGAVESYRPVYSLADVAPPFRAVALSSHVVVLAVSADWTGLQLWVPVDVDWRVAGRVGGPPCITTRTRGPLPFAAAALPGDDVVVVDIEYDDLGLCVPRMHVISPAGEPGDPHEVAGNVVDPETGDPAWVAAEVVAVPTGAVGVLWLSLDGQVRVSALAEPGPFDFDAPAYDAEGDTVMDARLLATKDRLILTFRRDEGGDPSGTQAVVIDPAGPRVSDPFRWPVDDAQCADLVGLPRAHGVDYACVAPCEGAGCREHWLYSGRVLLP
jgi:hypothetical protein